MNNIIQSVLLGAMVVGLSILGFVAYDQQQDIALLKDSQGQAGVVVNMPGSADVEKALKADFVTGEDKNITGKIVSIQGDVLVVTAMVPDIEALKKIDISKPFAMPRVKRTYSIRVTSETVFPSKKLAELKVGDTVEISSAVSVLAVDNFIAKEVLHIDLSKKPVK